MGSLKHKPIQWYDLVWVGSAEKNYERKGRRMMDGSADTSSDSICRGGNLPHQRREVLWQSWGGKSLNGQHWVAVIMGLTSTMSQKKVSDRQQPTEDIRIGRYELVSQELSEKKNISPLTPRYWGTCRDEYQRIWDASKTIIWNPTRGP